MPTRWYIERSPETCRGDEDGNDEGQDYDNKASDADSDDDNNDEDLGEAEADCLPEESDGAGLPVPEKMGRGEGGDLSTLLHKGLWCRVVSCSVVSCSLV